MIDQIQDNKVENTKTWVIGNKWFNTQITEIHEQSSNDPVTFVNNSCMFLMDLKRAGDGLQIETAKHTVNGKAPIFITRDYIAATISANNGIRTILTTKKGQEHGTLTKIRRNTWTRFATWDANTTH